MNTVLIGIGSIVAILALVFVVAYISVLVDTCEHYKMMAERYEEAYFDVLAELANEEIKAGR